MAVRLVCSFLARPVYTSDSDVISFRVYASKFSPPSCRYNSDKCSLLTLLAYRLILTTYVDDHTNILFDQLIVFE